MMDFPGLLDYVEKLVEEPDDVNGEHVDAMRSTLQHSNVVGDEQSDGTAELNALRKGGFPVKCHHCGQFGQRKEGEIHLDYCFLREAPGMRSAVILVGKERQTKMMLSCMVPYTGVGTEWVTALLGRDLRNFGIADNSTVVLKSDQEPVLIDMLKDVQRWRVERNSRATTTIVHSSVHDSRSNGFVERGVRRFEQIFRTHKLDLERKVGKGVDVHLPVMAWLAEHVADMYNKSHVYEDGKTAYEKLRGRKYKGEMLPFGCQVLHRGVVAPRWLPGTWLEKTWSSDEHLVATETGKVVRARSVRRMPEVSSWSADILCGITGQPWGPTGTITPR